MTKMTDLIPNSEFELERTFTNNPIAEIVKSSILMRDMNLETRTRLLAELIVKIDALDTQGENAYNRNMVFGIGSSFAMMTAIASSSALNPLSGLLLSGAALVSWGGTMFEAFNENARLEPLKDKLKRLSIALKSSDTTKWAALWQISGNDVFVYALEQASTGHLVNNKLIQPGGDTPIDRAIDTIGSFIGKSYDEVVITARGVLEGRLPSVAPQRQMPTQAAVAMPLPVPVQQPQIEQLPSMQPTTARIEPVQEAASVKAPMPAVRVQAEVVQDKQDEDIVDLILRCVNSIAFIGGQRCGKSLLMAVASKIGYQRGRFKKVFSISSLAKEGEDPLYWQHCTATKFYDLGDVTDKSDAYDEFIGVIKSFTSAANQDNPCLLIVDEFYFLAECLEWDVSSKGGAKPAAIELMQLLVSLCTSITSGGEKRGKYVWFGSPQGDMSALTLMKKIKKLSLCFAAIAPDVQVPTPLGSSVSWSVELFDATERNWSLKTPPRNAKNLLADRILFFNNEWHKKTQYDLGASEEPQDQSKLQQAIATSDALEQTERASLNSVIATVPRSQTEYLLMLLEKTKATTLSEFIEKELGRKDKEAELKQVIPKLLEKYGKGNLLKKFSS